MGIKNSKGFILLRVQSRFNLCFQGCLIYCRLNRRAQFVKMTSILHLLTEALKRDLEWLGYKITYLVKKLTLQYQRRVDGVKWVQLVTHPRNMKHRTWKHPRYLTVVQKTSKSQTKKTNVRTASSLSQQNQGLFNNCELSDPVLAVLLTNNSFRMGLIFSLYYSV